jgi:UDP-N-acetyl-2-amino-2-deoxyglucuronate dehydrogenase
MKKIRVGILGTGNNAQNHFLILSKINKFDIKGVCGRDSKRLIDRAKKWNVNSYQDVTEMVKGENLDVVLITNKNFLHYHESIKVINAGAHIVVEKPIDADFNNSKKLVNYCTKKNKIFLVVMQKRFDKGTNFLKKLILEKKFGKITTVKLDIFMHRNKEYFLKNEWIKSKEKVGGGITLHHGIHSIDQLLYILNKKVSKVSYWISNKNRKMQIEDTSGGWIQFDNNLVANINATVCAHPDLLNKIEIYGDKLSLCLEKNLIYKLPIKNNKLEIVKKFNNSELGNFKDVWLAFSDKFLNKKKTQIESKYIIGTEKLIHSMYLSSKTGKNIDNNL